MNPISMTQSEKDALKLLITKEPSHRWMEAKSVKICNDRFIVGICVICRQRVMLDVSIEFGTLPSCSEYRMNAVLE